MATCRFIYFPYFPTGCERLRPTEGDEQICALDREGIDDIRSLVEMSRIDATSRTVDLEAREGGRTRER